MWRVDPQAYTPVEMNEYTAHWDGVHESTKTAEATVKLPRYRGARKGTTPTVGTMSTPLHLTADPCPSTTPQRIKELASKAVVGIKLGWNYAVATASVRHSTLRRRTPGSEMKKYKQFLAQKLSVPTEPIKDAT